MTYVVRNRVSYELPGAGYASLGAGYSLPGSWVGRGALGGGGYGVPARVSDGALEYVPAWRGGSRGDRSSVAGRSVSFVVDVLRREFRRVTGLGVEVIPFDSVEGRALLVLLSARVS